VDGCGLPLSMSSKGKSFRLHNPSLETAVTSYESIVKALREADDHWWNVVDPDTYRLPSEVGGNTSLDEEEEMEEEDDDDVEKDDDDEYREVGVADAQLLGRPSFGSSSVNFLSDEENDG
jgi:hypothetical protein